MLIKNKPNRAGVANGNYRHGGAGTPEYIIWKKMRQRCLGLNDKDYDYYGGRGITICRRWDNFSSFLKDMGVRPTPKHSIDRIDNDGNYEPSNCRWATKTEQSSNKRMYKNNKTGFRGVNWEPSICKYAARIKSQGQQIYLGLFTDPKLAAITYDIAAIQLNSERAKLNLLGELQNDN